MERCGQTWGRRAFDAHVSGGRQPLADWSGRSARSCRHDSFRCRQPSGHALGLGAFGAQRPGLAEERLAARGRVGCDARIGGQPAPCSEGRDEAWSGGGIHPLTDGLDRPRVGFTGQPPRSPGHFIRGRCGWLRELLGRARFLWLGALGVPHARAVVEPLVAWGRAGGDGGIGGRLALPTKRRDQPCRWGARGAFSNGSLDPHAARAGRLDQNSCPGWLCRWDRCGCARCGKVAREPKAFPGQPRRNGDGRGSARLVAGRTVFRDRQLGTCQGNRAACGVRRALRFSLARDHRLRGQAGCWFGLRPRRFAHQHGRAACRASLCGPGIRDFPLGTTGGCGLFLRRGSVVGWRLERGRGKGNAPLLLDRVRRGGEVKTGSRRPRRVAEGRGLRGRCGTAWRQAKDRGGRTGGAAGWLVCRDGRFG